MDRAKLIKLRNALNTYLSKYDAVTKLENLEVNISDQVQQSLQHIGSRIDDLAVKIPNDTPILPPLDVTPMVKVMHEIKDAVGGKDRTDDLIEAIAGIQVEFPKTVNVGNFPPQKIPAPVTNININGLQGLPKSQAVTVTTTATPLPATPLDNRRSLIVWNHSSDTVIYIGGADVTAANGVPVKPQNYSPAVDLSARPVSQLYGIVDAGTAEARVLELSMSATGA